MVRQRRWDGFRHSEFFHMFVPSEFPNIHQSHPFPAGQPRARWLPSSLADVLAPLADVLSAGVAVAQRGLVARHRHRAAPGEGTAGGPTGANRPAAGTGAAAGTRGTGGVWDEFWAFFFFHFGVRLVSLVFFSEGKEMKIDEMRF